MVLNTCEMWSNGIKIAFCFKKIPKNRPAIEGFIPSSDGVEYSTSEYEYEYLKKLRVRVRVLILKNVLEYEYRKKVRVRVLLQV